MTNENEGVNMKRLIGKIDNSWKVLRVLLSVVVCAVLLIFIVKEFVPSRDTYGSIFVDSPEVYTRERLVNDRFLQDAWLNRWLELKGGNTEFVGNKSYRDILNSLKASFGKTEKNNVAESPESSTQSSVASLSTGDVFVDMVDFRDRVRNYKIENQLDDRHDLNGNTLYRFKFDATIIPGDSTRALAKIKVILEGPKCIEKTNGTSPEELKEKVSSLREVYKRWLLNLQARLNRTHREQKQAYYTNKFKKEDYTALRDYFIIYHDVELTEVKDCNKHGGGDSSAEAKDIDHSKQRACILSIVRYQLEKERSDIIKKRKPNENKDNETGDLSNSKESTKIVASGKFNQTQDDTPRGEYGSDMSDILPPPITELRIEERLKTHLNTFIAPKTLQLVFGIRIPMSNIIENSLYGIPQLEPLTKISFFEHQLMKKGYKVFTVEEKTVYIAAVDLEIIKNEESFKDLSSESENEASRLFYKKKYDDFNQLVNKKSLYSAKPKKLHISTYDENWLRRESYPVSSLEFIEIKSYPGAYVAKVEVGLRKFAEYARAQTTTYAYAVTPKMRSENEFSSFQRNTGAGGSILSWLKDVQVQLDRTALTRIVNRKGTVVGFSEATSEKEAVFGWIIGPRMSTADSREKIHAPVQESLSALVSLPSWWNKAQLKVTTAWIGPDGKDKNDKDLKDEKPVTYQLDLPPNYEQLEADILKLQELGPEVMESMLGPIRLTACKPGAIVIPGGRLWRSTVVTLGYQTADRIFVLPNMKGIIARFDKVENQMSVDEEKEFLKNRENGNGIEIKRTVRVWTSQGTIALPEKASIGILNSLQEDCPAKISKKKRRMNMATLRRKLLQFALMGLLIVTSVGAVAQAGGPVSTACQTNYGVCYVQYPVRIGTFCYCGNDPGRIVYPQEETLRRDPLLSEACATRYGVCRVDRGPIGSVCYCGPDPGRRISR